jgi:hypothetical protein
MERPIKTPPPTEAKEIEAKITARFLDDVDPSSSTGPTEIKTRTQFSRLPHKRRTGFFDLPYELRLQIYRLSLPTKFLFEHDAGEYDPCFGFSGCNRYGATQNIYFRSQSREFEPYLEHSEEVPNDVGWSGPSGLDDENRGQDPYNGGSAVGKESINWLSAAYRPDRVKHILRLLSVSRQIREEVLDVLYGENLFLLDPFQLQHAGAYTPLDPLSTGTEGGLQRMRHIMLVPGRFAWTPNHADFKRSRFYTALKDIDFPRLKTLCIVVRELQHQAQWIWEYEYIPTLLMYLRRTLPASVRVYVDANGYGPHVEAFERMLLVPQGFQRIQTMQFGSWIHCKFWFSGFARRPRSFSVEEADQRHVRELLKQDDPFDTTVSQPST